MKKLSILFLLLGSYLTAYSQAEIKFEKTCYDLGVFDLTINPIQHCEIKFTNIGNEPLMINSAIASSSKISLKYPKEPILPNESGIIEVTCDASRILEGMFKRVITIRTNGNVTMSQVYVQGEARKPSTEPNPREEKK